MQAANKPAFHRRSIKPERFLALGFFILIVAGGFVLTLPVSSADGRTVGIRQAMFSATSAVCVTGRSIVDVGVELSFFGQAVLRRLIQVGGLGFMAFATLIMVALGRRISLRDRMILRDAMNQEALSGMVRLTLAFFLIALVVELTGAALLMTRLIPLYGPARGVWQSLFTSVSAFCNAGFDLFGGYRSLTHLQHAPVLLLTLGGLIMVGGLGFPVILECLRARFRWRKLPLHAKLVLAVTAGLIVLCGGLVSCQERTQPVTLVMDTQYYDTQGNYIEIPALAMSAAEQPTEGVSAINQALRQLTAEYQDILDGDIADSFLSAADNPCLLYPSETQR